MTYRFANLKLQRGLSPSPSTPATAWADVVYSKAFQVLAGRFTYFTAEGAPSDSRDATRRIDLVQLRVRIVEGAETRDIPAPCGRPPSRR